MATVCKICAGPIEPPDQHYHCVTCLVLAHAEAALDEFRLWTLRGPAVPHAPGPPRYGSRPNRGEAHCRQHVACGPPSPGGRSVVLPLHQNQRSPHSPVYFPRTASALLLTSRSVFPLARRRGMTRCPLSERAIRPRDWFSSMDLKDTYFHIQIAPLSAQMLSEVCIRRHSIPILCTPVRDGFGPRTFSKCMGAALSPLRASRMRILNYLADWLALAPSRDTLLSHIDTLLRHLESLGLCVNIQKSIFVQSQSITHMGVCFDSVEMRDRLFQ